MYIITILRMGHTWIPRDMAIFQRDFRLIFERLTEETYNDPELTYFDGPPPTPLGFDGLAWWLSGANSPETDR